MISSMKSIKKLNKIEPQWFNELTKMLSTMLENFMFMIKY